MNEDIINLNRPKSKYPKMSIYNRASIFSPFAALTGYDDSIKETSRITNKKIILDEDKIEIINYKLNNSKNKEVCITYFIKDLYKDGGSYKTIKGIIKKIDNFNKVIIINNLKIKIDDIVDVF